MTLKEFFISMLSEPNNGGVSSARCFIFGLLIFFCTLDAWYFHRTGHLIDNTTATTQLGWVTSFYGLNKYFCKNGQ